MKAGSAQVRQQQERFARYCELRDEGVRAPDAALEAGLTDGGGSSALAYERAYKQLRSGPAAEKRARGSWP